MERACLPPLDGASFAGGGQFFSPLRRSAAAESGRWTFELLRDRHISPADVARLVNDFLARPNTGARSRRSSG